MIHKINHANIKEWAKNYDGPQFDGILCDPPYELGFMGKSWDSSGIAFDKDMWADLFRHIKPGGHLLAFSGSRTYHRMAVAIEDAGFEIRDMIEYVYGSGFPKSTNIYKQLKKQCSCGNMEVYENRVQQVGASREQEAEYYLRFMLERDVQTTKPITEESGQVLQSGVSEQSPHDERQEAVAVLQLSKGREKSSLEERNNPQATKGQLQGRDISEVSRKVSTNGEERRLHNATQASNGSTPRHNADEDSSSSSHRPQSEQQQYREPCTFCEQWGTQATRSYGTGTALKPAHEPCVLARKPIEGTVANNVLKHGTGGLNIDGTRVGMAKGDKKGEGGNHLDAKQQNGGMFNSGILNEASYNAGRFPANLIHDGSDEVVGLFPQSKGMATQNSGKNIKVYTGNSLLHSKTEFPDVRQGFNDNGSASRFFYCAKASKSERNAGLEGFEEQITNDGRKTDIDNAFQRGITERKNHHPTVKPLSLTKYLATLIKPPTGGRLLVPFSGSGSEMIGALQAGWEYVEGVELTEEYIPIAEARIKHWTNIKEEKSNQMELI